MTKAIQSTGFNEVHDALQAGDITLADVEARFVDLKTAFQRGTQGMELNERYERIEGASCWDGLTDTERQQVVEGCSFNEFSDPLERWIAYAQQPEFVLPLDDEMRKRLGYTRRAARLTYQIECDGSKSAKMVPAAINALYAALWPEVPADSGDTMNSFWTTYKQALHVMGRAKWRARSKAGILAAMTDEAGHLRPEYAITGMFALDRIDQQLKMLAYLTHTIGNFIPCDGPFNSGRYKATDDYWDATLEYVRDWYLNRQGVKVESDVPDVGFNAGVLAECRGWLDSFGRGVQGWNAFVEENYLSAYVETDPAGASGGQGAYVVRSFFAGHGFGHLLPKDPPELQELLAHMNAAIVARGNQMLEALGHDARRELFVQQST